MMTMAQRSPAPAVAIWGFLSASLLALMLSGLAAASPAEKVGKVARLRPQVGHNDSCNKPPQDLCLGDAIKDVYCISTGDRHAAGATACPPGGEPEPGPPGVVMKFDSGKIVGLGPGCFFDVRRNHLVGASDTAGVVALRRGACDLFAVSCKPPSRTCKDEKVTTVAADIWPEGTIFHVRVESDGSTEVAVFEGSARVESLAGGKSVVVDAGFRTLVKPGRRPTLPAPIDDDGIDQLRSIFDDSPWLDGPFDFEPLKSTGGRSNR